MVKNKISTDFSLHRYTDKELNVKVDAIIISMTDNTRFSTPTPNLITLKELNDRFALSLVKMEDGKRLDTSNKRKLRKELVQQLQQVALYVQLVSGGDEEAILCSGFDMNRKATPVGQLEKAVNLKVRPDDNKGSLIISWEPVEHAIFYELKYTEAPSSSSSTWTLLTTTRHRFLIEGLTSGKQYTFMVAGAGTDSSRIWSNEITSYVL